MGCLHSAQSELDRQSVVMGKGVGGERREEVGVVGGGGCASPTVPRDRGGV